jgi:hypothetical protein
MEISKPHCNSPSLVGLLPNLSIIQLPWRWSIAVWNGPYRRNEMDIGADQRILAGLGLARTLWLQGFPAQAIDRTPLDHRGIGASERSGIDWTRHREGSSNIPLAR